MCQVIWKFANLSLLLLLLLYLEERHLSAKAWLTRREAIDTILEVLDCFLLAFDTHIYIETGQDGPCFARSGSIFLKVNFLILHRCVTSCRDRLLHLRL